MFWENLKDNQCFWTIKKNLNTKSFKPKNAAYMHIVELIPNCSGRRECASPHKPCKSFPWKVFPQTKIWKVKTSSRNTLRHLHPWGSKALRMKQFVMFILWVKQLPQQLQRKSATVSYSRITFEGNYESPPSLLHHTHKNETFNGPPKALLWIRERKATSQDFLCPKFVWKINRTLRMPAVPH